MCISPFQLTGSEILKDLLCQLKKYRKCISFEINKLQVAKFYHFQLPMKQPIAKISQIELVLKPFSEHLIYLDSFLRSVEMHESPRQLL